MEHIIREDYIVEAMEVIELYCDLLLARFGMLEQMSYVVLCHCVGVTIGSVCHCVWGYCPGIVRRV